MGKKLYKIEIKFSINEIKKYYWEKNFVGTNNPFYEWEWLANLENSKSVSNETGWQPLYFVASYKDEIVCIAPLFLKNHSYGEFIFDQSFARLAQDLNLNYYPKLIGMSPYSPVEGYQFFYTENIDKFEITKLLIEYIEAFSLKNKILSCNFLYVNDQWGELIRALGYHDWINTRSEWESNGENNFEDYLKRFNSNQRKNIKKERKSILEKRIDIKIYAEENINKEIVKNMHYFYEHHCSKWGVWGSKYLTYQFFENCINLKKNLLIFAAYQDSSKKPLAMSMCIKNSERLWGRYWGSLEDINNLHFELCYYQPIEWALKNNIKSFDPGAGGKQKRRRGFYARASKSFHKWFNLEMENIICQWLLKANTNTINEIQLENDSIPFIK
tara:strand:+ start:2328 stop:3485 length:1158 start_codon:yes stop_codon:yes gene_type:complete